MSLPIVNLVSGVVSWTPPTPVPGATVTGYIVGLRSLSASGTAAGVYPITSAVVPASATTDALSAITASLKADNYAASVQSQSANGPSAWAPEFQFQGVLPSPNPPGQVTVA